VALSASSFSSAVHSGGLSVCACPKSGSAATNTHANTARSSFVIGRTLLIEDKSSVPRPSGSRDDWPAPSRSRLCLFVSDSLALERVADAARRDAQRTHVALQQATQPQHRIARLHRVAGLDPAAVLFIAGVAEAEFVRADRHRGAQR